MVQVVSINPNKILRLDKKQSKTVVDVLNPKPAALPAKGPRDRHPQPKRSIPHSVKKRIVERLRNTES